MGQQPPDLQQLKRELFGDLDESVARGTHRQRPSGGETGRLPQSSKGRGVADPGPPGSDTPHPEDATKKQDKQPSSAAPTGAARSPAARAPARPSLGNRGGSERNSAQRSMRGTEATPYSDDRSTRGAGAPGDVPNRPVAKPASDESPGREGKPR
jgi:hypothetical protein